VKHLSGDFTLHKRQGNAVLSIPMFIFGTFQLRTGNIQITIQKNCIKPY